MCIIAIVLFIANIYVMITCGESNEKEAFYKTLNPSLKKRYENIIEERKSIYFKGFGLGIILSAIVILSCNTRKPVHMACLAGAITFSITYLFYIIHPKSDYMILHLTTEKERSAWLDIYRSMQLKYHMGLVIGIAAAMAGGYSICPC